jgi:hypothetical protein
MAKKQGKSKKVKGKRKAAVKRFPIPLIRAERLGYRCANLADADNLARTRRPLAAIFKTYPPLAAAWRRGKLLRELNSLGRTMTVTEGATQLRHLGYDFPTGQSLRDFLDGDPEAHDVWHSAWVHGAIDNRKRLLASAETGDVRAMRMIDIWYKDGDGEAGVRVDYGRLNLNQLAELFGVTRGTGGDWYKTKGLPRNGDGSFDIKTAIRWYGDYMLKKAGRHKGPITSQSPFQDVKTQMAQFKLAEEKGEYVTRTSVIGLLIGCMEKVTAVFHHLPDYANRMFAQEREQIVGELEGLRDDVTGCLQQIPETFKLSAEAAETLRRLYEQIAPRAENKNGAQKTERQGD